MSYFKTKAIVLKKQKIKDHDSILQLFSYEYWLISAFRKEISSEKKLDLWYIINCEIETKNEKNTLKNIKIKSELNYQNLDFSTINQYLHLILLINKNCPKWSPIFEIFEVFEAINNLTNLNSSKIIYSQLKILHILWVLNLEHSNETVKKILIFISKSKIENILKLETCNDEVFRSLEKIVG